MKEIWASLWLGSFDSACDLDALRSAEITHILIAAAELQPQFPTLFTYFVVPLEDTTTQSLREYMRSTCEMIGKVLGEGGKMLVHCRAGVSRSASLVLAYVMQDGHLRLKEAMRMMQAKGTCIGPNPNFLHQLQTWERELFAEIGTEQSFFCRNCNSCVFSERSFHPHSTDLNTALTHCEHIFLIRLEGTQVTPSDKTLLCITCGSQLGDTEIFCMCGKSVLPSFRIEKTKVS